MRVLLVDDSELVRERVATLLAEIPEEIEVVGQARDPAEATESIRRLKPDVVILDIRMPGGSGIDLLQTLKRETPRTTVIILTGYPYPPYRQKCAEAGADFFLDKASDFERLPEILQQLAHRAPAP